MAQVKQNKQKGWINRKNEEAEQGGNQVRDDYKFWKLDVRGFVTDLKERCS